MSHIDQPLVVVVGPFPPPIHGAAIITDALAKRLGLHAMVIPVDTGSDPSRGTLLYHLKRVRSIGIAITTLLRYRRTPNRVLYISVAGGAGAIYDTLMSTAARYLKYRILLHHHSFSYLDRSHRLSRILLHGTGTTHLVLCPTMGERLRTLYGATDVTILSNAWWLGPPFESAQRRPSIPIRLGHLGNLCHTKGLPDVLSVFNELLASGANVSLSIAGPTRCAIASGIIQANSCSTGFRRLGHLDGEDKRLFFDAVDVFLFPSRYRNEAEPLVVYEALAEGCVVLASNRGCIPEQLDESGGHVFDETRYVSESVAIIHKLALNRDLLEECQRSARVLAQKHRENAELQLAAVLDNLVRD